MDILKMLSDLRAEQQRLTEAIIVVERLAIGSGTKRRGRPPKWMSAVRPSEAVTGDKPKVRRPFSAATRKKMAAAQKRRWAARKLAQKAA